MVTGSSREDLRWSPFGLYSAFSNQDNVVEKKEMIMSTRSRDFTRFGRVGIFTLTLALLACSGRLTAQEVAEQSSSQGVAALQAVSGLPLATCFVRPVANYKSGDGCLEFLQRNPMYSNKRHAADDFCAPATTTRVSAVAAGKVMYARAHQTCPNWGQLIAIEHLLPNGSSVVSIYGHVIPSIREGDLVSRGQQIGTVGKFSCWSDHVHFGIAQRDYGAAVGTYASWLKGYLDDSDSISPYISPEPFILGRLDCPPTVGNHTYRIESVAKRIVTVRFTDPEGLAPSLKVIKYQYKDPTGQLRTGTGEFTLSSGSAGNGTYGWSAFVYGTQFKFYTEWRDAGSNSVRYPASGLIE